jgi:pimeloyl-ACP methyl ester carboxylesterase
MSVVPARLTLEGADGLALAADAYGDEGAPVVFLLHGGGQTRHSWGGTAALLAARGYRAITLDQRGHGESTWDAGRRYKQADFGRDVHALSQRFDKPIAVVGASLGGNSALLASGDLGATLSALVLVDIGPKIERTGVERIYEFMRAKPDGFDSLDEVADLVSAYQPHRTRPKDVSGAREEPASGRRRPLPLALGSGFPRGDVPAAARDRGAARERIEEPPHAGPARARAPE